MPAARAASTPGRRVLDDDAVLRREAHPRGGVEEEVGRGLAALDVERAEDAALEAVESPVRPSVRRSFAWPALEATQVGRSSASRASSMPSRREARPGRRRRGGRRRSALEGLGQRLAAQLGGARHQVAAVAAHELGHRLLDGQAHAELRKRLAERGVRQDLGVDQHPVASKITSTAAYRRGGAADGSLDARGPARPQPRRARAAGRDRQLVRAPAGGRYGAGMVVSEMISSHAIHYRNERTLTEMLRIDPREREAGPGPIVHPAVRSRPGGDALRRPGVAEAGADLIDLNMGCPVPKVMKTGAERRCPATPRARSRSRWRRVPRGCP